LIRRLLARLRRRAAPPPAEVPDGPLVVGIGMVKNEQDVIEPFVRHNLRVLDALVLLDNGSVDGTRRILDALAQETGRVAVADAPRFGYRQAEWTTRLLHAVQGAFFADVIVALDADEFIDAPDRAAFLDAIARIPSGGVGLLSWRTLVPTADADAAVDPPRSLRRRRRVERPQFCKVVLRLDGSGADDLALLQGNHEVARAGTPLPPALDLAPVRLLHAPVRSAAQITAKAVVGWLAYLAKDPDARAATIGSQWRALFDRVAGGTELSSADLAAIAIGYAQDDDPAPPAEATVEAAVGWDYRRRHSDGRAVAPVALIARTMEQALAPPPPKPWPTRPPALATAAALAPGAFDPAWHWDHVFLDLPPLLALAARLRPASVLDVGCGIGLALEALARAGVAERMGVDGLPPEATALPATQYRQHDLTRPLRLGRRFDLVLCLGVAEHLPPGRDEVLLDSIARHAGTAILFSAAEPGQPGHGHVNCQLLAVWLAAWRSRGWVPELIDSLALRSLASLSWLRRNPVLLRRADAVARDGTARLLAIAARRFAWWGQRPGIRDTLLDEPPPPPGAGYV
jgi:SAM-dependent methyltransferase